VAALIVPAVAPSLSACGKSEQMVTPSTTVAQVSGEAITDGEVEHRMRVDAAEDLGSSAEPAAFRRCAARYLPRAPHARRHRKAA
jgi:hypothetical protein